MERILVDAVPDTCDQAGSFISADAPERRVGKWRDSVSATVFESIGPDRPEMSEDIRDSAANGWQIDSLCHNYFEV